MKIFFTSLLLLFTLSTSAQQPSPANTGGCGTITPQHELNKIYDFVQHNSSAYHRGTAGITDSIPLSIHIVGTDAGTGYYSLTNLFQGICQLNQRYVPVGFHFYIQWPIQYINNTSYYVHDFSSGDQMMNQYNTPNSVNVYFVQDPAGACGYYTYGQDAVAIGKNCANNGSTTLTHELGHYFSLPHTFSGWEGGGPPFNPENVDRTGPNSNCNSAGDGFCDTYADYLSVRWACPGPRGMVDATGTPYHLDSSMYMSYSLDACQSQFSEQQMAAMQYDLHIARQSFPGSINPQPHALDSVKVMYPRDTLYANLKQAVWKRVTGADHYYVRITLQSSSNLISQTAFTTDTFLNITASLVDNAHYVVNVIPVNAHNTCMEFTTIQPFVYSTRSSPLDLSSVSGGEKGIKVYPNPVVSGTPFYVNFNALPTGKYSVNITGVNGQVMMEQEINHPGNNGTYSLSVNNLPQGLYLIRCKGTEALFVQKLLVQP